MADPAMLFDLNVKDITVRDALTAFFDQAGRGVSIEDDPTETDPNGVISVRAADLEFREALALLLPKGYAAVEGTDGVYHIRRM